MAGLDPKAADRAADMARADDPDLELAGGGLRRGKPGIETASNARRWP